MVGTSAEGLTKRISTDTAKLGDLITQFGIRPELRPGKPAGAANDHLPGTRIPSVDILYISRV